MSSVAKKIVKFITEKKDDKSRTDPFFVCFLCVYGALLMECIFVFIELFFNHVATVLFIIITFISMRVGDFLIKKLFERNLNFSDVRYIKKILSVITLNLLWFFVLPFMCFFITQPEEFRMMKESGKEAILSSWNASLHFLGVWLWMITLAFWTKHLIKRLIDLQNSFPLDNRPTS